MSENEALVKLLRSGLDNVADGTWVPLDHRGDEGLPLELRAAHSVAGMAVYFEAAEPGRGRSLLQAFADDPPELCPRLPKFVPKPKKGGPPPPPEEEPIDPRVLGASLVVVSDLIANQELSGMTRELGQRMMG